MEYKCAIRTESGHTISRPPLRVNNVARRLRRSERRVRQLASAGELAAFKIDGKSWGFRPEDVEAYQLFQEALDAERY
jgi:excisionase family DNA binding protein